MHLCVYFLTTSATAIAGYIPIANPRLPNLVYEIVLNNFLQYDHTRFLATIREWPSSLYDVETVINAVLDHLRQVRRDTFLCLTLSLLSLCSFSLMFARSHR